jgi:hypothetical protein
LQDVFDESIDTLVSMRINFGAHTDEHAKGKDCGCGAIDRAPEALVAALKYEVSIRKVIALLGVDAKGLDDVFTNFRAYMRNGIAQTEQHDNYSGRKVMEHILANNKVIKRLGGNHLEKRIVLNQVRNYTINQGLIRDATQGKGQVFAIDTWRLEDIASSLIPKEDELQSQAILSEMVYTLATAAVLTKGDLPVYMAEDHVPQT